MRQPQEAKALIIIGVPSGFITAAPAASSTAVSGQLAFT